VKLFEDGLCVDSVPDLSKGVIREFKLVFALLSARGAKALYFGEVCSTDPKAISVGSSFQEELYLS
jgi:hypothetical protein